MGDNFVYSKRDLILVGVTVGIIVVTLGLGFGLQKGVSLPGTKGQIISQGLFGILGFFQKMNKQIRF